jgi:hypothetical protein
MPRSAIDNGKARSSRPWAIGPWERSKRGTCDLVCEARDGQTGSSAHGGRLQVGNLCVAIACGCRPLSASREELGTRHRGINKKLSTIALYLSSGYAHSPYPPQGSRRATVGRRGHGSKSALKASAREARQTCPSRIDLQTPPWPSRGEAGKGQVDGGRGVERQRLRH